MAIYSSGFSCICTPGGRWQDVSLLAFYISLFMLVTALLLLVTTLLLLCYCSTLLLLLLVSSLLLFVIALLLPCHCCYCSSPAVLLLVSAVLCLVIVWLLLVSAWLLLVPALLLLSQSMRCSCSFMLVTVRLVPTNIVQQNDHALYTNLGPKSTIGERSYVKKQKTKLKRRGSLQTDTKIFFVFKWDKNLQQLLWDRVLWNILNVGRKSSGAFPNIESNSWEFLVATLSNPERTENKQTALTPGENHRHGARTA